MAKRINWLGRALGLVCAAALASAWALVLWVPSGGPHVDGFNVVDGAVVRRLGGVRRHRCRVRSRGRDRVGVLASFFPIGVSLLPSDHWLQWVGWLDLGLLAAAVLIWVSGRVRPRRPRAIAGVGGCSRMAASSSEQGNGVNVMHSVQVSNGAFGVGGFAGGVCAGGWLAALVRGDAREAARRLDGEQSARVRPQLRALGCRCDRS